MKIQELLLAKEEGVDLSWFIGYKFAKLVAYLLVTLIAMNMFANWAYWGDYKIALQRGEIQKAKYQDVRLRAYEECYKLNGTTQDECWSLANNHDKISQFAMCAGETDDEYCYKLLSGNKE